MSRTLTFSRLPILKRNSVYLLFLQKVMAHQLSKFQLTIQEGKKLLFEETNILNRQSLIKRLEAHKQLSRVLQTIADGIAWRNLGCQRALMRLLSENDSPGYIDKELDIIMGLKSNGVIIVNDLTRFCRIGDFTHILPDGKIIIYEAKTSKSKTKLFDARDIINKATGRGSPKITIQERRHFLTQNSIIKGRIEIPIFKDGTVIKSLEADIVDIDIPIKTYFRQLREIIKRADKDFLAYAPLEPGYFLKVQSYDALEKPNRHTRESIDLCYKRFKDSAPKWMEKIEDNIIVYDSYYSFVNENNQFARNVIPYSLLPLDAKQCMRIMFGHVRAKVYFDLNYLEQKLIDKGWVVTRCPMNPSHTTESERDMFRKDFEDAVFRVSRVTNEGQYSTSISGTEIIQMISSFYSTDFLLDSVDYRFMTKKTRLHGSSKIAPNYPNEKQALF